ncbi:unnamed protein product [Didymodactylos carnosus]|uniref:Uncharacterized protein n=1 Tax=Didymodactylos carnosus TaxID=1234261 RepID=A0A813NWZ8_9BILA|nr:unnamed protein product [Didymodactylos carnosus]CAF0744380.1 unnamed protein product [Didymodactylos carnosus]CAF3499242.1 unnamed protein product [Didymodactylos carnosus]CAF3523015.1 unnamed protein product [Didymodactylos carnosus]
MSTSTTTARQNHIGVSSQIPTIRNRTNTVRLSEGGVPVKFADNTFSVLVKNQIIRLLDVRTKTLTYNDENGVRTLTYEITEIIKTLVCQHIKDNFKAIIQVISYPKQEQNNILIMSRCLWNHKTDDVLTIELETDLFRFVIVIHGVAA